MNALTITSSKRYNSFEKMLSSLSNFLEDESFFDIIIHYDDSSSKQDRDSMQNLITKKFPSKIVLERFFEKSDFDTDKRHMEIMKVWKKDIESMNLDYVFHTEDDFLYKTKFNLSEACNLLKNNTNVAYVGFSQEIRDFPDEYKTVKIQGNFWEWLYDSNKPLLTNLFLDTKIMAKSTIPGYWCYFINWPYFSLRPGIHDVKKLKNVETFNSKMSSFELEFSIRYANFYKSYCHLKEICTHLDGTSAYELNNSSR